MAAGKRNPLEGVEGSADLRSGGWAGCGVRAAICSILVWHVLCIKRIVSSFFDKTVGRSQVILTQMGSEVLEKVLPITPIYILMWSQDGANLIFRAREGGENPYATVWTLDPGSAEPEELFSVSPDLIIDLSISADGKRAAMLRGKLITDAIMMTV